MYEVRGRCGPHADLSYGPWAGVRGGGGVYFVIEPRGIQGNRQE